MVFAYYSSNSVRIIMQDCFFFSTIKLPVMSSVLWGGFLSIGLITFELPPFLCIQERALPIGMEVQHFSAHCSGGGSAEDPGSLL